MLKNVIKKALFEVGVKRGDTVLVHADASAVIKLLGDDNWDNALVLLKTSIVEVLGEEGTLIVPTFNWDFCRGIPYDAIKSPSKLGLFSNYILRRPEAIRSVHPMFSFAGIGPQAESLFNGISKSSFGHESVFDRLMKKNARLVFLNTGFFVCTFVHHVEHMRAVPYRYTKHFTGQLTIKNETYIDTFEFYVRDEKLAVNSYPTRLGDRMLEKGLLQSSDLGRGKVLSATCGDVYNEAVSALEEDSYFLLLHPPTAICSNIA